MEIFFQLFFSVFRQQILTILSLFLAVTSIANCAIFDCKFRVEDWSVLKRAYTCSATVIFTGDGSQHLVEIRGEHLAGNSNVQVEALSLQDQDFRQIPRQIGSFFPNLRILQWANSNLWGISPEDLWQFPNLMLLDVRNNKIVSLENDVFACNPKLLSLNFDSNLLYHVGKDSLSSLKFLTTAYFRLNPCYNSYATSSYEIQNIIKNLPIQCPALPPQQFCYLQRKSPLSVQSTLNLGRTK